MAKEPTKRSDLVWVTFTEDAVVKDGSGNVLASFEKGKAYELEPDQARRWTRRWKAVEGRGEEAKAQMTPPANSSVEAPATEQAKPQV